MALAFRLQLRTVAAVAREPKLLCLELSWGGHYLAEWMSFVALSIYAYNHGGASAVGVFGLLRMGAAAIALPFGAVFTDRFPRQRVLVAAHAARAAALGGTAAALAAHEPRALVFGLAALAAVVAAPIRPATMSLTPLLARTSRELVAANVCSSAVEGLGTLAGPLLGGALAASPGPAAAVTVAAAVSLAAAAAAAGARHAAQVAVRATAGRGLDALLQGARTLRQEPHPRLVVLLFASQTFVRGLLNVELTVVALDVLGIGRSGLGWLNGAIGAGAILGGIATAGLVTRRRLAGKFALALALWSAPIALIGLAPHLSVTLACAGAIGVANALLDVSGFTLLQRTVDEHVLGRVFGVFEVLVAAGVALGSAVGAVVVDLAGLRAALVATGLLLPLLAAASLPRLRRIDEASAIPMPQLDLVANEPLFRPLPATTRERLAHHLQPMQVPAGTTIVEQGDRGDLFYLIAAGTIEVETPDGRTRLLGPGESFGEIALLRDVPRTATCRARTNATVYGLDRDAFVAAVSGDLHAAAAADLTIRDRLTPALG